MNDTLLPLPKASEVIIFLQKLVEKHGDLPLCAKDPDTHWRLRIGIVHKSENTAEEWPERFEIRTAYYTDPKGDINHGK